MTKAHDARDELRTARWERSVARALRLAGWYVIRPAGPLKAFDLVALRPGVYMCIACATDHARARRKLARMKRLIESGKLSGMDIGHLWVAAPTVPRKHKTICLVNAGDQHPRFFLGGIT
jgi:hypothetical protein